MALAQAKELVGGKSDASAQEPAPKSPGKSEGFVKIPRCRPFIRCPLATNYEKVMKVGQGTFGLVTVSFL